MKKNTVAIFLVIFFVCSQLAIAQHTSVNVQGMGVLPISHATLELTWKGKVILFDPSVNDKTLADIKKPDIVFITDIHPDHLNADNLNKLKLNGTPIVAPQAVADKLPEDLKKNLIVISNGESKQWQGIKFEAIPMYNLPGERQAYHTKGRGNGYVLTLGNKRVYISGDTEDIPEMRLLKNIDLAFVCMNLPYTMTVERAADGVVAFSPKEVIPYHYRGGEGLSDIQKFKQLVSQHKPGVNVRLLDFYPKD